MAAEPPAAPGVVFFDLASLLVDGDGRQALRAAIGRHVAQGGRLGVLTNAPGGLGRPGLLQTLATLGLDGLFDPAIVIDAATLPTPLPDRRAFLAAAAMAEMSPAACRFVTRHARLAAAAADAGMAVEGDHELAAGVAIDAALELEDDGGLALEAAPIDDDTGPTFVLRGRIVTMSRRGVVDGRIAVRRGRIAAIVPDGDDLPATLRSAPAVETGGTIYPGLIDLHNHYVYDVAPLWRVPRRYLDRSEWSDVRSKRAEVSLPVKLLAGWAPTARAIARYVEAKALMGGTTAGQGMKTPVRGGWGPFRGAMRNVESAGDPRLPDSGTLVGDLRADSESIETFRLALRRRGELGSGYFYHLAEGTDHRAAATWQALVDNGLVAPSLVGIHALGVDRSAVRALREQGASVVWSPFSNLLLYGRTVDLRALDRERVRFAIGADWSPSGSKNLLQELKVARHVAREQDAPFDARRLVRAVTVEPAAILGWARWLGALRVGSLADVLVVDGVSDDPYEHLVDAVERDVRLVTVHGVPRYGDRDAMAALHADPGHPLEPWSVDGAEKAFALHSPTSPINDLTLAGAEAELRNALEDLPAFADRVAAGRDQMAALGMDPTEVFTLALDNEDDGIEAGAEFDLAAADAEADRALLPPRLELDGLVVGGDDYWSRIDDQPNLDASLKAALRAAWADRES